MAEEIVVRPARIAFIGFGEAARAFLAGWRSEPGFSAEVAAFDIKTDAVDPAVRAAKLADYAADGVVAAATAAEAVAGADLVVSVVTADQAHAAALSVVGHLAPNAFFFDCNSCAPQMKVKSAAKIDASGGRYLDVAVMAPVHPRLHRTPLLTSGPNAEAAAPLFAALGMAAEIQDGPVGSSSSIKMVRSIMIKGLEALVCECVLSGRLAGVDDIVLATLEDTFPGFDWPKRSAYMLERVMTHGIRRAAEMREVALTVDLLGLEGRMARAIVDWQQEIGDLRLKASEIGPDHGARADAILAALGKRAKAAE
jgi:3-hydroxyisobutyrate dehydrogenase-like beta-hydroxyacid dehydrogenase